MQKARRWGQLGLMRTVTPASTTSALPCTAPSHQSRPKRGVRVTTATTCGCLLGNSCTHTCIHTDTHIHTCAYMRARTYTVRTHAFTYVCAYTHTCAHACIHARSHTCAHVHAFTYMHRYTCSRAFQICACIYMHVRVRVHTCTIHARIHTNSMFKHTNTHQAHLSSSQHSG